ncbi:MAG: prepilin-type N-terminal cleavage/methylation domain-containing protein [Candidatus Nomurabacteria bacterium]|nr:prepilin-type N-terminal cleavage/methylation domain-containing protein [Candidatus Nomurabacteria bacterium]
MLNFLKINRNKGFTLIEILMVIAILGIISSIVLLNLSQFRNEQLLKNTTLDVVSLLSKARQNTLSSVNSTNYGIHFDNDKAVLFTGSVYSSNNTTNEPVVFSSKVIIPIPSGLNIGGGSDVIFERLTGETVGGTIKIQLTSDSTKQKIITVGKIGNASSN